MTWALCRKAARPTPAQRRLFWLSFGQNWCVASGGARRHPSARGSARAPVGVCLGTSSALPSLSSPRCRPAGLPIHPSGRQPRPGSLVAATPRTAARAYSPESPPRAGSRGRRASSARLQRLAASTRSAPHD